MLGNCPDHSFLRGPASPTATDSGGPRSSIPWVWQQGILSRLFDHLSAGDISVLVDRTYPLAEAAAAHAYIESRQAVGRVLRIP